MKLSNAAMCESASANAYPYVHTMPWKCRMHCTLGVVVNLFLSKLCSLSINLAKCAKMLH